MTFVKKQKGAWNHQNWLDFLAYLEEKQYFPIDTDKVWLLLEEKKKQYLESQEKDWEDLQKCKRKRISE